MKVPLWKKLREIRKRLPTFHPKCPICDVSMKRKGKKGPTTSYWKCLLCKGKLTRDGTFFQAPNQDTLDIRNYQIKALRKEFFKRKLIMKFKKKKYSGLQEIEWEGELLKLEDYDIDGISFEEKRKMEEEQKKRREDEKRKDKRRKEKNGKEKKIKEPKKKKVMRGKIEKPTIEKIIEMADKVK